MKEKKIMSSVLAISIGIILVFVGYNIGKDLAARHNRIKVSTFIE